MLSNKFFPYSSMQEINLDWILTKVKNLMRFLPDDGSVGQILRRTAHGAEWSNEQGGGGGAVSSVNGQTGTVVLTKSDIGLGYVANVLQYSSSNPPPYPVTSVNGQTGDVVISTGAPLDAYPVGSIYMSVNSTSPAILFGGTWEQIEDTFLLAAGTNYAAGATGGEAAHTLTVNEMPSHSHRILQANANGTAGVWVTNATTSNTLKTAFSSNVIEATGGGHAHNNMPPYMAVYIWKRTA